MFGEQLLIKIWETLTKEGIGSLLNPWQIKREGKAHLEVRRNELLMLAQTERDVNEIRNGIREFSSDMKLIETKKESALQINFSTLIAAQNKRQLLDNLQKEININKTIVYAEESAMYDNGNVDNTEVNSDWMKRWREYAQRISEEDLQHLWANVLNGEVKNPGSYSLRTLDFIKNLSRDEANKIALIAPYVVQNNIFFRGTELSDTRMNMNLFIELSDLGLLNSVTGISMSKTFNSVYSDKFEFGFIARNKVLVARDPDPKKEIKLECYGLTHIGQEILSLGHFDPNVDYILRLGNKIKTQGFEVFLGDFERINRKEGRYSNAKLI
jgi:hypothetical protein